ncbi:MAG: PINc/VapC family ATPase, partial [Candidatus Odinarchaeia archaeon]
PDTSVIIDRYLSDKILKGELTAAKILIPNAVIAEIEYQANFKRATGFSGLDELKKLKKLSDEGKIELEFVGARPSLEQVKLGPGGEIDEIIVDTAVRHGGELYTSDRIQKDIAEIKGVTVNYVSKPARLRRFNIEKFFDETTMSVHLREGVPPKAKKGMPGNWKLVKISEEPLDHNELMEIATQILERATTEKDSFIEIDEPLATIVQLGNMRIVIARPPFSDAIEITAVRPIKKATLEEYNISKRLEKRFEERAEGILIAGPPGAGKSTFGTALAEFYKSKNKIVKTMENPRDLQVSSEITQYSPLSGRMDKTADVLLLVRPDYVIYDEMRKTIDFKNYVDLRFSGVNMIGVVHASKPIDALQRFIGRIELGLISRVLDTIIFIERGEIEKVYSIKMTVKVPSGMVQADLSRPVIEVRDFETNKLEYEIYTYGEEVVVIPIAESEKRSRKRSKSKLKVKIKPLKKNIRLLLNNELAGQKVRIYCDSEPIFEGVVNNNGYIVIKKSSNIAKKLITSIRNDLEVYAKLV